MRLRVGFFVLVLGVSFAATAAGADHAPANGSKGGPVAYTVMGRIERLPNGGRPEKKIAFPEIADWSSLKIKLERSACFGSCPDYQVEVRGDGTVGFEGRDFVAVTGKHGATIPRQSVRDLFEKFKKAEFFWLLNEYNASKITDNPTYIVSISFDGRSKTVVDYVGQALGMPKEVSDLENAIDSTAAVHKWVSADAETFGALKAEGWDFRGRDDEHVRLLASAAQSGSSELVKQLLDAGVDPQSRYGCEAISAAAERRDVASVRMLAAAKVPSYAVEAKEPYRSRCLALHSAVVWSVPEIVELVLSNHPDVNARDERGNTALMVVAENDEPRPDISGQDFSAVVRLLIRAGAQVNARNGDGESAIMMAHSSAAMVRALLKAGATDVNTPGMLGYTPLMNSYHPDVTQALLETGANPYAKSDDGKTALDLADDWRKTATVLKHWMTSHPAGEYSQK